MRTDHLEQYQKLVNKLLNNKAKPEELSIFLRDIENTIQAYAQVSDEYSYLRLKWEKKCKDLCSLRDLITTEREKYELKN